MPIKRVTIADGQPAGQSGVGFQRNALREAVANLPGLIGFFNAAPGAYRINTDGTISIINWVTGEWWTSEIAVSPTQGPIPMALDNGEPYFSYPGENNGNAIVAPADWQMPATNYTLACIADLRPMTVNRALFGSAAAGAKYVRFYTDEDQLVQIGLGAEAAHAWADGPQLLGLSSNDASASLYRNGVVTNFAAPHTVDATARRLKLGKYQNSDALDGGVKVYAWIILAADWNLPENQPLRAAVLAAATTAFGSFPT